jgi:hypothetical protein
VGTPAVSAIMETIRRINLGLHRDNSMGPAKYSALVMGVPMASALLAILGMFTFVGCHHAPLSDEDLTRSFLSNEGSFRNLAAIYTSGHALCSEKSDADTCVLSVSQVDPSHILRSAHVQVVYVKKHHGADDGLWLPVQTYGAMSTSSSTRGYVYLDSSPQFTVPDTLGVDKKGSFYKPLKKGWYIFTCE